MADTFNNSIDIKENYIYQLDKSILEILLKDHSSGKNILWATDMYAWRGVGYQPQYYITVKAITGFFGNVIKPRIKKSQKEQRQRIKTKAEVFTPSWICNQMANALDATWFGRDNVFNTEQEQTWISSKSKISFQLDKTWQDYVNLKVLEITCGEAPFLVSRYDTVTGKWLEVNERIGLLDRKLRIISENVTDESEWVQWAYQAYKSTYGYEWQGDSVLIARENLLFTFIDFYIDKFKNSPINQYLIELSKIISWNIWQMDGLKNVIPNYGKSTRYQNLTIFNYLEAPEILTESGGTAVDADVFCRIKNWQTNRIIKFDNIKTTTCNRKGENKMKFDFVIGNPPYQMLDNGSNDNNSVERTSAVAVYPHFVTSAKSVADVNSLIIPSRWMTGGKGLDKFRKENIEDTHYKVIHDYENDKELFPNTDIGGGVMIYIWDINYVGKVDYHYHHNGGCSTIKRYLNTGSDIVIRDFSSSLIVDKIDHKNSFMTIVSPRNPFNICGEFAKNSDNFSNICSNEFDVKYYCWDGNPTIKYVRKTQIENVALIESYKVFISKTADPPMRFGRENKMILRKPFLGKPDEACSETYLTIGNFTRGQEPQNVIKYIKTKFFRFLILQKKKTQNVSRGVFEFVPLQDFTNNSDIDWSKSIAEIDQQLYKKYGLTADEINFIETHIREMD